VYDTFETWKIKGKTLGGGKWDYKAKIKNFNEKLSTELKLQFPWNRYWFWLGVQSAGKYNLKLHIDAGDFKLLGRNFNLFGNLKTQTDFQNFQFRLGANYWGSLCESNTRLEINSGAGDKENSLTQRTLVRRGSLFYGFVGTIGLQGWNFNRYDAILGYQHHDVNFYLTHKSTVGAGAADTKDHHGFKLGNLIATGVVTRGDLDIGAEASFSSKDYGFALAAQSRINSSTILKGKITKDLDLTFAYKKTFNSLLTLTTSALLRLKEPEKLLSHKGLLPVPLGFQFELNI